MTLRAELWSRHPGSLHAGAAEPLPISPEGKMSLQRQEELETLCEQLRRQVGEMEVREAVARAVCPQEWGQSPPLWPPRHTPHGALLWFPSAGLT